MNAKLAVRALESLLQAGVREVCLCPGARNAPLIHALSRNPETFTRRFFFDERSAAFFALGRIRETGRPVAVVTTSGTAVGELLPAAMEAHHSGLALVLVSADRPRSYRGTGAPQATDQDGIFGRFCPKTLDLAPGEEEALKLELPQGPFHLNLCFEEPLINERDSYEIARGIRPSPPRMRDAASATIVQTFLAQTQRPFVLLGALEPSEQSLVREFVKALGAPVLAESLSGLREDPELQSIRIAEPSSLAQGGYELDGVLRIGGVPTLRFWRDLEDRLAGVRVLSVSSLPWKGLARPSELALGDLRELLPTAVTARRDLGRVLETDRERSEKRLSLFRKYPKSEPGMVHAFSEALPAETSLFLGNSLPIREWDLAATGAQKGIVARATRGLNGIDGQVSTFIGLCRENRPNWALLGDLTALYDLAGPWALSQRPELNSVHLAVLNNSGGMIFDRMFKSADFLNRHELELSGWGQLWKLPYQCLIEIPERLPAQGKAIWELVPDAKETQAFWTELQKP